MYRNECWCPPGGCICLEIPGQVERVVRPGKAVRGCPCGGLHLMSPESYAAYERITRGQPSTIEVKVDERSWLVPRLYIACHPLRAPELAQNAAYFGWEEVTPTS